jgi:hypothetical protein
MRNENNGVQHTPDSGAAAENGTVEDRGMTDLEFAYVRTDS